MRAFWIVGAMLSLTVQPTSAQPADATLFGAATFPEGYRCAVAVRPIARGDDFARVSTIIRLGVSSYPDVSQEVPIAYWQNASQPATKSEFVGNLCQLAREQIVAQGRWPKQ